jgi:hypothetical protein
MEVPFAVSQKGIADGVEIRITHIPRAVQKLLEEDLITEFKTHFRGHLRKRKAYFLTEKGTEKAVAVKDTVGSNMVTMKTKDGNIIEKKLLDMFNEHGYVMNFFKFYTLYTKNSVLEESELEDYKTVGTAPDFMSIDGFKDFRHNIPDHQDIIGRSEELAAMEQWLTKSEQRLAFITGEKGIGKTALAAEIVLGSQTDSHLFWISFQPGNTFETLIYTFAELTASNTFFKLEKYLKQTNNIIPTKACELLGEELTDLNMLIILDDIHNIKQGIQELEGWLTPLLKFIPQGKIMITSRDPMPVELRSKNVLEDKYLEVKLEGLDMETSRKLFSSDLSANEFESIYNYTEGNPLYLKAIQKLEADGELDLKNFRPEELSLLKFLKMQEELD